MAVVLTRPDAATGTLKCGNLGAVGTSPCYDGVQAYLACDSKREKTAGGATAAVGIAGVADKYNSVFCRMKEPVADVTVYDLMPATSTDTATIDKVAAADVAINAGA